MTDLGTHRLMQDGSPPSDRSRMLRRIAEVLDRPVSDFYRDDAQGSDTDVPSAAECDLMLKTFLRVKDAEARILIIDMMRAYSDH